MEEEITNLTRKLESKKGFLGEPNTLDEICSRLANLSSNYSQLMRLNQEYLEEDPRQIRVNFDEESGIFSLIHKGEILRSFKINRADPNVPVKLRGKSSVSAFTLNNKEKTPEEIKEKQKVIGALLESFYFNASKIWDLVEKSLCKKTDSKFIGVKMVRNKLIEHTQEGDIYSFGVSEESGPSVKPIQLSSRKEKFHDKGLVKNTEELLLKINQRLNGLEEQGYRGDKN